jgi:hypothetical protein
MQEREETTCDPGQATYIPDQVGMKMEEREETACDPGQATYIPDQVGMKMEEREETTCDPGQARRLVGCHPSVSRSEEFYPSSVHCT